MFSTFSFVWMWEWSGNLATTSVTQLVARNDSAGFNIISHYHRCVYSFLSEEEGQVWLVRNEG